MQVREEDGRGPTVLRSFRKPLRTQRPSHRMQVVEKTVETPHLLSDVQVPHVAQVVGRTVQIPQFPFGEENRCRDLDGSGPLRPLRV